MPNPEEIQPIEEARAGDETSEAGEFVEPIKTPVELADERLKDKLLDSEAEIQKKLASGEITQLEADELLAQLNKLGIDLVGLPVSEFREQKLKRMDAKFLAEITRLYEEGVSANDISRALTGINTIEAINFREQLIIHSGDKNALAWGLAGVDSYWSWDLRDQLKEAGADENFILMGLAGIDSGRAWEMRDRMYKEGTSHNNFLARSLTGIDSDRAWSMRNDLLFRGTD